MFPGSLFAKFVYSAQHRAVENSQGVRGIVHFWGSPGYLAGKHCGRASIEGWGRRSRDGRFLPQSVLFEFLGRSAEMEISAVKVLAA
jgi:hypothetical protein